MRVAVTGAQGRLGRALIAALEDAPFTGPMGPIAWSRPDLDLDTLTGPSVDALIARDRPEVVIHAAAWTDVDGCAKDPDLAMRRNGTATGLIADACAARGVQLAVISTNEVFDGTRTDGRAYAPGDERRSVNAYGASKLEGERLVEAAATAAGAGEAVGGDRPDLLAARPAGERLPGQDRGGGAPCPGRRPAAQGGERRDRHPDVHAGRGRRHRRADLGGRAVRRSGQRDRSTTS